MSHENYPDSVLSQSSGYSSTDVSGTSAGSGSKLWWPSSTFRSGPDVGPDPFPIRFRSLSDAFPMSFRCVSDESVSDEFPKCFRCVSDVFSKSFWRLSSVLLMHNLFLQGDY